jgi:hypothetical protein
MRAVDDILRRVKRLKRHEISRLIRRLEAHVEATANGAPSSRRRRSDNTLARSRKARPGAAKKRAEISYARSLAWSGTAGSGVSDVSSNKGKYLAEAYMPRRDA